MKNPNLAQKMQTWPGVAPERPRQADVTRSRTWPSGQPRPGAGAARSQLEQMMNNLQAGRQQQRGQNGQQNAKCARR